MRRKYPNTFEYFLELIHDGKPGINYLYPQQEKRLASLFCQDFNCSIDSIIELDANDTLRIGKFMSERQSAVAGFDHYLACRIINSHKNMLEELWIDAEQFNRRYGRYDEAV